METNSVNSDHFTFNNFSGYLKWCPDKIPPEKIPLERIPLNAVEHEPVPTRVLNPNASESSYKPKQHSYRKTKLKKKKKC